MLHKTGGSLNGRRSGDICHYSIIGHYYSSFICQFFVLLHRLWKIGGGLVTLMVCAINMYFVVVYVTAFNSVVLYAVSALFSIAYLIFIGYLVGTTLSPHSNTISQTCFCCPDKQKVFGL